MWLRVSLVGACLAVLLSACAVVDPVDQRYDTVSRSLAKARNDAIFLNLVRAGHDYPLSFTTIANVTPGMTNTASFGLPTFGIGPKCFPQTGGCVLPVTIPGQATLISNTTASASTAISSNFNIATQETSAFYLGFLKPIDLHTLNYFIRQDYPRELLFWLFAASFHVGSSPLHSRGYQYDPPNSYGCARDDPQQRCFREWVWVAVLSGLTVEEKAIEQEAGGHGRFSVARFCFSPQLARKAREEIGEPLADAIAAKYMHFPAGAAQPVCGTWSDEDAKARAKQPQGDTFDFSVAGQKFSVVPRSAYGVFEFLGVLIRMQTQHLEPSDKAWLPPVPPGEPDEAAPPALLTTERQPLIMVLRNGDAQCFAHTSFFDGEYCVPEAASNTKRIFSLLAQLIAIETTANDLSITPVVRVIQ